MGLLCVVEFSRGTAETTAFAPLALHGRKKFQIDFLFIETFS